MKLRLTSFITFLKSNLIWSVGIVFFFITLGLLFMYQWFYRIEDITIRNNPKQYPISGIPAFKKKSMLTTSEESIKKTLLESNPVLKDAVVTKIYPDSVNIVITVFEPKAYLKTGDGYFLLTEEARVLAKSFEIEDEKLPIIAYYQNIPFADHQAGSQLPAQDIKDSLYFFEMLRALKIRIISIDIAGFHMLGLYTENQKFYFTSEKDRTVQMYHIEQAIHQFKNESKDFKTIDVRFDKPVITL